MISESLDWTRPCIACIDPKASVARSPFISGDKGTVKASFKVYLRPKDAFIIYFEEPNQRRSWRQRKSVLGIYVTGTFTESTLQLESELVSISCTSGGQTEQKLHASLRLFRLHKIRRPCIHVWRPPTNPKRHHEEITCIFEKLFVGLLSGNERFDWKGVRPAREIYGRTDSCSGVHCHTAPRPWAILDNTTLQHDFLFDYFWFCQLTAIIRFIKCFSHHPARKFPGFWFHNLQECRHVPRWSPWRASSFANQWRHLPLEVSAHCPHGVDDSLSHPLMKVIKCQRRVNLKTRLYEQAVRLRK